MAVMQEMWDLVKGTENRVYVSNPRNGGGLHNYGAAVDLTLVDSLGHVLSDTGRVERADFASEDSFHILEEIIDSCDEVPTYMPLTKSDERFARLSEARSAARR